MIADLLKIFWLFLPAAFANMAPVLFSKINFLNYPVDLNLKLNKKPLFGKNKTYRGFFFGIICSIITVFLQKLSYPYMKIYSLIDYSSINISYLGFMLGFGALLGDLVKSFAKRRLGIKEGRSWLFFDQTDWIIGAIIFAGLFVDLSIVYMVSSILIFGLLHVIINYSGYLLKIKKNKF